MDDPMFSISRNTIIGSTFSLLAVFSSATALASEGERNITLQEDVSTANLIKLNVPVGEVIVSGTTGNNLTAVATISCQKEKRENCYQLLKELSWSKTTGNTAEFSLAPGGITRYDHVSIKIKFGVPQDKKLDINLSAGELRIDNTSACLNAEVNAGEINIKLKEDQLDSAKLTAKVGDVKLVTARGDAIEGERSMLVGASLDWKGTGTCQTKASVLAGEVHLELN